MKLSSNRAAIVVSIGLTAITCVQAQIIYDNLGTAATAGYSELNANHPIFGDALNLTQGGVLGSVGLSLFNSSSGGNTGSITNGSMVVRFYDNTVAYAGGALNNPLLGSATVTWNFTAGLGVGFYSTEVFDVSALNIALPQHILVTQQFTETSGTSTRNGAVLFSDPTIGTSPANVYINSSATAEGLYTFANNPGQFGYTIQLVPEPTTLTLAGLALVAATILRRRV